MFYLLLLSYITVDTDFPELRSLLLGGLMHTHTGIVIVVLETAVSIQHGAVATPKVSD